MAKKNTEKEIESTLEYKLAKEQTLVYIYDSITKDHIYKTKNTEELEKFYSQIKDIVPSRYEFFENWFKGFIKTAEWNFTEAKKSYGKAFEKISDAHEYSAAFIQQGFALFMYANEKDEARRFWDYGLKSGYFFNEDGKFFDTYNEKEQFWVQFSPDIFTDEENAHKKAVSDYRKIPESNLQNTILNADYNEFEKIVSNEYTKEEFNKIKIESVSPLYYEIQIKQIIKGGSESYTQNIIDIRTEQLMNNLNLTGVSETKINEIRFTVIHQMKFTYGKSGLGKIIFEAMFGFDGNEKDRIQKIKNLEKIISRTIELTDDPEKFTLRQENKMSSTALLLAAETDDAKTAEEILKKTGTAGKTYGQADFSMMWKDKKTVRTKIPNSFIYRLINFKAWETLEMFLKKFTPLAEKSMTERSEKQENAGITPLVYMILTTIYSSKNEQEFNKNKGILESFIPLFLKAGASLEQNTVFGTAKSLLGTK